MNSYTYDIQAPRNRRSGAQRKRTTIALASGLCSASLLMLVGCGGGGGDESNTGGNPAPTLTTATGVAAIGAPIVGGSVELKCASGATASASTDTSGIWTTSLKATDYPCVSRVSGGQANGQTLPSPLHSVVSAAGTTNITPLTDLIVGILSAQNPATWYASTTSSTLGSTITSSAVSSAQGKLKTTLATLPGKPTLPDGFDPLTTKFSAAKGDAGDDILESYSAALTAAGLTQSEAATHAAAGEALTQEASVLTAFTTPNLTTFRAAAAKTLWGDYTLSIPDPNRGTMTAKAIVDTQGNVIAVGSPFIDVKSLLGNRIGQLCTAGAGAFSNTQRSQYVYVSEDLTPVTDVTELYGKSFTEYEDCASYGTSEFKADGSLVFTETGKQPDTPDVNFGRAFTVEGYEDSANNVLQRAKAYKYTANGQTTYVYFVVSTQNGSTMPALNGETDFVLMGVSQ